MQSLLTLEEAQAAILARAIALPAETVPVERAAGRVVAEPALARVDLPPFASSAMDGFAVRAKETPATLPIAFSIAAGRPSSEQLPVGSAATIATGGAVPEGADAIVPVEQTVEENGKVRIAESARPEAHIRPRGGDVREARWSSRRAFGWGLRRSARLPRPASPKSSAHDVRASPSSPPASSGRRATSSSRGRSTSRTAR